MKRIAIIPARGGSKRLPGKNVMDFLGKPMIQWTIDAARKSGLFARVVVSTDDAEIARVSLECGAEVPVLRTEAADDFAPVSEATLNTLKQVEDQFDEQFDEVWQLFAVCPLRTAEQMKMAARFFTDKKADFLISCFEYQWMNPWWANTIDGNFRPTWLFPDGFRRSQDLPKLYCPTGAIWIARAEPFKKEKTFYGPNHVFWPMDWMSAVDIDEQEDVVLAETLYYVRERLKK